MWPRSAKSIVLSEEVRRGPPRHRGDHDAERAADRPSSRRPWTCSGTAASAPTSRRRRRPTPRSATGPTTPSGSTATELRCAMVVEGGNLGLTQRGRVEAALDGVLVNTDAIDNSAGVDCSDHEVNIKILLDAQVAAGDLTVKQRNELLASMTDEVADLVLEDNRAQTLALADRPPAGRADGRRPRPLPPLAGGRGPAEPGPRVPADREAAVRAGQRRPRADDARVRRAAGLHEGHQHRRRAALGPARRSLRPAGARALLPQRRSASASPGPWVGTGCGGRSSPRC